MNYQINVSQQPDGSLAPNHLGEGVATVNVNNDPTQPKTAIITFFGFNQAVVNFDETGTQVLNYTLLNPAADFTTQRSVENLIRYITSVPQLPVSLH
jgi:hypothetical protein